MDTITTDAPAVAETRWIDLHLVDIANTARTHDPGAVETLVQDMKAQGQLQEIVVAETGGRFEVVAGVGRVLAARKLAWNQIRASVRQAVSDFGKTRITYAENEDREEPNPFYQAALIKKMMESRTNRQELANDLGMSDSLIDAYMAVADLPEGVKSIPRRLGMGQLTQITRLKSEEDRISMAKQAAEQDLSVRELKGILDKKLAGAPGSADPNNRKQVQDMIWKGGKIVINRPFDPASETAETYIAWLTPALEAFAETKPIKAAPTETAASPVEAASSDTAESAASGAAAVPVRRDIAELEALGQSGPGPIYAKLAPGSPVVEMMKDAKWSDLGAKDVKDGLPQLLAALKIGKEHGL